MVLTYPELVNEQSSRDKESEIIKIQQMLDQRKNKTVHQVFDDTGRKLCALLLPKGKMNVQ